MSKVSTSLVAVLSLFAIAASCRPIPIDLGPNAAVAGQSTVVLKADVRLGSCEADFKLGWSQCLLEKGTPFFPTLFLAMTGPGEYAVGDCELGIYKTGAVSAPEVVEIPLDGLREQANRLGLCILKIETVERYPDPNAEHQMRNVYMRGGFFIEMVTPGFFPVPENALVAFCVKILRTTAGRTKIEKCKP